MLVRRTQDPEYWRSFTPTSEDIEYVRDVIVETARPMGTEELARAVVYRRVHQERERIRELLERGRFYRPADEYEVGEELIFPALDFATGVVVGKREGHWPHHPAFEVITVQLGPETREFAAGYDEPHRLNQAVERVDGPDESLSPAAVYERMAGSVPQAIERTLSENADGRFVAFDHRWFLRELMPDVHLGYLNLAEAVIDVAWEQGRAEPGGQRPLSTDEILDQIDLSGASTREVARFALEVSLEQDERFIDVGSSGEHLWLLRRLVPSHAVEVPERLRYEPITFSVEAVPTEALSLVWGVADELSTMAAVSSAGAEDMNAVEIALPYPHLRAGTLPLTGQVAAILPARNGGIGVVTLVDEANDERLTAWISYENQYVSSLAAWYGRHEVPAGAFLTIGRTDDPSVFTLGYRAKRRTQREYVRVALATEDKLTFEIRRQPMAVEFDETMIMLDDDSEAVDRLWKKVTAGRRPMSELLREVFVELAKLSPQGTVHFNTLYTAINVIRRCPPEPILAELSLDWRYVGVGSGYYAMDERVAV